MTREPVAIINAVAALFTAIVTGLAYAFGWSDDAVVLIGGVTAAASALAATVFARSRVTPV